MASEPQQTRLPIATNVAKGMVDASLRLLGQLAAGRSREPATVDLREAARALHAEIAGAEFEARLPNEMRARQEPMAADVADASAPPTTPAVWPRTNVLRGASE